jgi:hypothetical protein
VLDDLVLDKDATVQSETDDLITRVAFDIAVSQEKSTKPDLASMFDRNGSAGVSRVSTHSD